MHLDQSGTTRSAGSALGGIDRSHAALGIREGGGEGDDLEGGSKKKDQLARGGNGTFSIVRAWWIWSSTSVGEIPNG